MRYTPPITCATGNIFKNNSHHHPKWVGFLVLQKIKENDKKLKK
jgi:hypothetical protein